LNKQQRSSGVKAASGDGWVELIEVGSTDAIAIETEAPVKSLNFY
jgi:hypothetical protein